MGCDGSGGEGSKKRVGSGLGGKAYRGGRDFETRRGGAPLRLLCGVWRPGTTTAAAVGVTRLRRRRRGRGGAGHGLGTRGGRGVLCLLRREGGVWVSGSLVLQPGTVAHL
ncbi:hypothetical protein E2C01_056289 [Portunus trituberculatus]|uniref:Uncharacterized protein n=1 Tax=Portunus trituberculatus TaxID=210409 RepID=A0A5B7GYK1_PORTR|nr:hypothetical protein [Portunus trituberculatus]